MSWYSTKEDAAKAAAEKTKEFAEAFIVLEDIKPGVYWAQRKSALK